VKIPICCDFCGQVQTKDDRLNYDPVCDTCKDPRPARLVVVSRRRVTRVKWRRAS
jgi:hypothetical protein